MMLNRFYYSPEKLTFSLRYLQNCMQITLNSKLAYGSIQTLGLKLLARITFTFYLQLVKGRKQLCGLTVI